MPLNQVPQPGQTLLVTRNPINQNWTTINAGFLQNHVELGIANAGKHKFLQMPEQGAAPATLANEAGLYAAVGANSNVSELVFRRENNGTSIAFTESQNALQGWCRLPCGLLMRWDTVSFANNPNPVTQTVLYAGGTFPGFATAVYTVQVTSMANPNDGIDHNNFVLVLAFGGVASFTAASVRRSEAGVGRPNTCTYLAIGI